MKCSQCVEDGEKSTVTSLGGSVTLLGWSPYYDEDGKHHAHDPNKHTSAYRCSRSHAWVERRLAPCPTCGQRGGIDVSVIDPEIAARIRR